MRFDEVDAALLSGNFAVCGDCHSLLDRSALQGGALVPTFSHALHLDKGAGCDSCHLVPTHTEEGVRSPDMVKCFGCHSQDTASAPSGECDTCHPPVFH
ncbi:MAG: cytochrome c3 family protein [Actinobacteria bacterium]|nr:cytochrome c3 family protein [Actinomycetota bacterium]